MMSASVVSSDIEIQLVASITAIMSTLPGNASAKHPRSIKGAQPGTTAIVQSRHIGAPTFLSALDARKPGVARSGRRPR